MKARHFKTLRKTCQWYDVETAYGGFGKFKFDWSKSMRVLAKTSKDACNRARRRGYGLNDRVGFSTDEVWAHWRVKLTGKSNHFKNVTFF